jgi:hypothetical protein
VRDTQAVVLTDVDKRCFEIAKSLPQVGAVRRQQFDAW